MTPEKPRSPCRFRRVGFEELEDRRVLAGSLFLLHGGGVEGGAAVLGVQFTPTSSTTNSFTVRIGFNSVTANTTDYSPTDQFVTFPNGNNFIQLLHFVSIPLFDDNIVEGLEVFQARIKSVTDASVAYDFNAAPYVTISDDDSATVSFTSTAVNAQESAGNVSYNLRLTLSTTGSGNQYLGVPFRVNLTRVGSTGTSDYNLPGTITFSPGSVNNTTRTAIVSIINDSVPEPTESFTIGLEEDVDYSHFSTSGQVGLTIINDDFAPVASSIPAVNVNEDAANSTINPDNYFSDQDDGDAGLTYTVVGNTNSALFSSVLINNNDLVLDYANDKNGSATITVRATDPGGNFATNTVSVTVQSVNDAPTFLLPTNLVLTDEDSGPQQLSSFAIDFSTGPIDEAGQTLHPFALTSDNPSLFSQQPSIDSNGQLTFEVAPGFNGTAEVTVALSDDGGTDNGGADTSEQTFTITANNAAPAATINGAIKGVPGQTLSYTLLATDPSPADQTVGFKFVVDWGDGKSEEITAASGVVVAHQYVQSGSFAVSVTAEDRDGAVSPAATLDVAVSSVLFQQRVLYVGGANARDVITLTPVSTNGRRIQAKLGSGVLGTYTPTQIVVYGNGGNDSIKFIPKTIAGKKVLANVPSIILGGRGNDVVSTVNNRATNVLVGDVGSDRLTGSAARDILIGGLGLDRLVSGGGEDILIAGATDHDDNVAALEQLMSTWNGTGSYTVRRKAIFLAAGEGPKLNKNTVFDDAEVDTLIGQGDLDWFLASTVAAQQNKDVVKKTKGEVVTQLTPVQ